MLNQIEKCCRYGENTGRRVIVDTDYAYASNFRSPLSSYFSSLHKNLILDVGNAPYELDDLDVFPKTVKGRISSYRPQKVETDVGGQKRIYPFCDEAGSPLCFSFEKDYQEQLLVHHQYGGGSLSIFSLLRMELNLELCLSLTERIASIGQNYIGVHIRHTDYQTDFEEPIKRLKRKGEAPILLATDSAFALERCRELLGPDRVFNFTKTLSRDQTGLHASPTYQGNVDAILDLFMLALSQHLLVFEISGNKVAKNGRRIIHSGFSVLANNLRMAKPILWSVLRAKDHELLSRWVWP